MASEGKGSSVLVVDDDWDMALAIQEILATRSYEVILARDGLDAIKRSAHQEIDLILLDLSIPVLSGFWFCDAFRKRTQTKDTPIVIISASHDKASIRKAYQMGASAYLRKPFRAHELMDVIDRTMIRRAVRNYAL